MLEWAWEWPYFRIEVLTGQEEYEAVVWNFWRLWASSLGEVPKWETESGCAEVQGEKSKAESLLEMRNCAFSTFWDLPNKKENTLFLISFPFFYPPTLYNSQFLDSEHKLIPYEIEFNYFLDWMLARGSLGNESYFDLFNFSKVFFELWA